MTKVLYTVLALFLTVGVFGQFTDRPGKIQLGYQTTANGLVCLVDSIPDFTPADENDCYLAQDTTANKIYIYKNSLASWTEFAPGTASIGVVDSIQFDTTYGGPTETGVLAWNIDDKTLDLKINGVTLQIGQEMYILVKNVSGATIMNGQAVRYSGALGASSKIEADLMIADGTYPAYHILGIATEPDGIANNDFGFITPFGAVRGINTSGYTAGDVLYVDPTTPGALTNIEPTAPNQDIPVAIALDSKNNGSIFVRPVLFPALNDVQDVTISNIATGQVLRYDGTKWANSTERDTSDTNEIQYLTFRGDTLELTDDPTNVILPYLRVESDPIYAADSAQLKADIAALFVDSTRLLQDSILVYFQSGVEVGRDTIAGTGGGTEKDPIYSADSAQLKADIAANAALTLQDVVSNGNISDENIIVQSSGTGGKGFISNINSASGNGGMFSLFQEDGSNIWQFGHLSSSFSASPTSTFGSAEGFRIFGYTGGIALFAKKSNSFVGIGTGDPSYQLDVDGNFGASGRIYMEFADTDNSESNIIVRDAVTGELEVRDAANELAPNNMTANYFARWDGNSWEDGGMSYTSTDINLDRDLKLTGTGSGESIYLNINSASGNGGMVEIFQEDGSNKFAVGYLSSTWTASPSEKFGLAGGYRIYNTPFGNTSIFIKQFNNFVGINTGNPSANLDVAGSFKTSGTNTFTSVANNNANTKILSLNGSDEVEYTDLSSINFVSQSIESARNYSATTSSTGGITISHSLGVIPSVTITNASATPYVFLVSSVTTTNFTIFVYDMSGSSVNSTSVNFDYQLII